MPDFVIPHPEEERSFSELRSEFRESNRQRIRAMLHSESYKVGPLLYRYETDGVAASVDCTLTEDGRWLSTRAFPVNDVPEKLMRDLERNVRDVEQDLKACLPEGEGFEHDGPPLNSLDEESVLDYMERMTDAR
jgi:hypothetical protein